MDLVWDVYLASSLKHTTREKRGTGIRRRVLGTTRIPKNWQGFLRVDDNKTELFQFLSTCATGAPVQDGKAIYATQGVDVVCSSTSMDLSELAPCSHEEADTRLLLHVADAVKKGFKSVCIRTVDTDVVIVAIACYHQIGAEELWVAFGTGAKFRYIAVHHIAASLDRDTCTVLPAFHAFTGCDTVSAFGGRGKKTAWETWKDFGEATQAFAELCSSENQLTDMASSLLERFVVLLYCRTSNATKVNDARKQLFSQKSRALENIPPTQDALLQHIKRASLQAKCWSQALVRVPDLPHPSTCGWRETESGWEPLWTTLPQAAQSCQELVKCSCKKGCTSRCKCVKAALECTYLCSCGGEC